MQIEGIACNADGVVVVHLRAVSASPLPDVLLADQGDCLQSARLADVRLGGQSIGRVEHVAAQLQVRISLAAAVVARHVGLHPVNESQRVLPRTLQNGGRSSRRLIEQVAAVGAARPIEVIAPGIARAVRSPIDDRDVVGNA